MSERLVKAYDSNLEALSHIEKMMRDLADDIHKIKKNLETLTTALKQI